jgi:two-component system chemotaxis sensor kinase CheA
MEFEIPPEILEIFAEEAAELLPKLTASALGLEGDDAAGRRAGLEALRRDLHTLKGSAGSVGLAEVAARCHELEDLIAAIDPAEAPGRAVADAVHDAIEAIRSGAVGGPAAPAVPIAVAPPAEPPPPAAPTPPPAVEPVAAVAPAAAREPGGEGEAPEPRVVPVPGRESVRVSVARLDALQATVGELVVTRLQANDLIGESDLIQRRVRELARDWRELAGEVRSLRALLSAGTARSLEGRLAGLTGELRELERTTFQWHRRGVALGGQLRVVTDGLEEEVQQARLMPLGPWLAGFAGSVREASRACGVQARMTWDDRGIEVDRMVLQRLRDPLLHLLRNAVAHGVEDPDERRAQGKDPTGTVHVAAERRVRDVELRVIDDGRGIDRAAVARRAVAAGLLERDVALDDERLTAILCAPGFSTAASVGPVAGRGIGLDVVADTLHGLQGSFAIQSTPAAGTTFALRVPASVTTTQGMIVQVGPYRFGLPLSAVERVIRTDRASISTLEDVAVTYVDGSPLTITSLADLVGALEHAPADDGGSSPTLVLRVGSRRLAAIVDDIPGEIPLVVRTLGPQFDRVPWLGGAAVQGDGSVLPILEPRGLIDIAGSRRRTVARGSDADPRDAVGAPDRARPAGRRLRVLVVDDSLTMRALSRNILEAAGYDVLLAADGVEGQERLRTDTAIDVVVTDLDMPRMSGFELCRWIRSSAFADLPVLMVTSLDSDEEKRRGLDAGADAYIVKGNFRQEHFLATVRRLGGA